MLVNSKLIKKTIIDFVVIANAFNNFYINIGMSLASKVPLPNTYIDPKSYIKKIMGINYILNQFQTMKFKILLGN